MKKEIDVSLSSIHYHNRKQGKIMFELVSTILNQEKIWTTKCTLLNLLTQWLLNHTPFPPPPPPPHPHWWIKPSAFTVKSNKSHSLRSQWVKPTLIQSQYLHYLRMWHSKWTALAMWSPESKLLLFIKMMKITSLNKKTIVLKLILLSMC